MEYFESENAPIIRVPASKSVILRKLLLSALSDQIVDIAFCGDLCEDVRAMINCLISLGVKIQTFENILRVHGLGGNFKQGAVLDVQESAATARFLAAAVAFQRATATLKASGTLLGRPMGILKLLKEGGAKIEPLEREGIFPVLIDARNFSGREFCVRMEESSQYLSALLLASYGRDEPTLFHLAGPQRNSGYVDMTLSCLNEFHAAAERTKDTITLFPRTAPAPEKVFAEADLSAASYFCALALLSNKKIFLENVTRSPLQPDDKFLFLLVSRGLKLKETRGGLLADGSGAQSFEGFQEDFSDFSDQALTAAALAPFASTPSHLKGLSHLRRQECDRVAAMCENLSRLGVPVKNEGDAVTIYPAKVHPAKIETFHDHRVAMAFSLIGAKTHVCINDPACTKKTFASYFNDIKQLKFLDVTFD